MPITIIAAENSDAKHVGVKGLGEATVTVTFGDAPQGIVGIEFKKRPSVPYAVKNALPPRGLGTEACHKKSVYQIKYEIKKEFQDEYKTSSSIEKYINDYKKRLIVVPNDDKKCRELAINALVTKISQKLISECTDSDNLFLGDGNINSALGRLVYVFIVNRSNLENNMPVVIKKEVSKNAGLLKYINDKKANNLTMEHDVLNMLCENCTIDAKGDCVVKFLNPSNMSKCWADANNDSPSFYKNKRATSLTASTYSATQMTSNFSSSASSSASAAAAPEKPPLAALTGASLSTVLSSTAVSCPQTAATAAQPPAQSAAIPPQNTH